MPLYVVSLLSTHWLYIGCLRGGFFYCWNPIRFDIFFILFTSKSLFLSRCRSMKCEQWKTFLSCKWKGRIKELNSCTKVFLFGSDFQCHDFSISVFINWGVCCCMKRLSLVFLMKKVEDCFSFSIGILNFLHSAQIEFVIKTIFTFQIC